MAVKISRLASVQLILRFGPPDGRSSCNCEKLIEKLVTATGKLGTGNCSEETVVCVVLQNWIRSEIHGFH